MKEIAILTDSNSGITQEEAEKLGIYILAMPFFVNEKLHFEGVDLSQEELYAYLNQDANVSTSQPSPGDVMELWHNLLKDHDEVLYIPMSSGLSASCSTAMALSEDFKDCVYVADNKRISVTQRQSVLDAKALASAGWTASQIKEILETEAMEASIYLMVDTLKFLKKGGRVTPAAAMIGTVLNIKPVLTIQGDKLDAFAKVRGMKQAKRVMLDAMKKDMETRFSTPLAKGMMRLQIAYGYGQEENVNLWREEVKAAFPGMQIDEGLISLSVACHTGPGVLAVACSKIPE